MYKTPSKTNSSFIFKSQIIVLQITEKIAFTILCTNFFFFIQPVTWLHVEKISSSIISSVSHGQNYAVLHVRDLCGG